MGQRPGLGGEETPTEGLGMEHPERGEDRAGIPGSEGGSQGSKPTLCGGSVLQAEEGPGVAAIRRRRSTNGPQYVLKIT